MRRTWVLALVVALVGLLPVVAAAQEDDLPVVTLSKDVDVLIGEEIEVTVDGMPGGWSIEDSVALTRGLAERGVDVIDCSSRGVRGATSLANLEQARRPAKAGYQVEYAEHVRRETGIPTMAVGLILTPAQAETILERGQADLVMLAREALYDPHWALHAARELGYDEGWETWPPSWGWWLAQRERTGVDLGE